MRKELNSTERNRVEACTYCGLIPRQYDEWRKCTGDRGIHYKAQICCEICGMSGPEMNAPENLKGRPSPMQAIYAWNFITVPVEKRKMPCPFCASKRFFLKGRKNGSVMECKNCGATGPTKGSLWRRSDSSYMSCAERGEARTPCEDEHCCPFCGGNERMTVKKSDGRYIVVCINCQAGGPSRVSPEVAETDWSERACVFLMED